MHWYRNQGNAEKAYYWEIIVDIAWGRSRLSIWPDIRNKLTKDQIAATERRAAAWLAARGHKYRRLDPPRR
jgi:hypothetical protein